MIEMRPQTKKCAFFAKTCVMRTNLGFRRARRDTEYGGQHIPPGARALRSNQSRVWWVLIVFRHT